MSSLGIISNPHSKSNKKHPDNMSQLAYILGKSGTMEITKTLGDLDQACERFCREDVDIVAINGGDGTISRTLTSLIKSYQKHQKSLPKIALLGGGTINVLVKNIGLTSSPRLNLLRLCERYSEPESSFEEVRIQSLNVDGHYGFLYADGICYDFLKEFYKGKKSPFLSLLLLLKLVGSVLVWGKLAQSIIRFQRRKIQISPGEEEVKKSLIAVMAATIPKIPFGIRLFPLMELAESDQTGTQRRPKDLFEVSFFFSEPRTAAFRIPAMLSVTEWVHQNDKRRLVADSLLLSLESDDQPSNLQYEYSLDGELFEAPRPNIEISLGPEIVFVRY